MFSNAIYSSIAAVDKVVEFKEITWWISTYRKFRKHNNIGTIMLRFMDSRNDLSSIAFKVTNVVVDLCECYFHTVKLKNDPDIQRKKICKGFII